VIAVEPLDDLVVLRLERPEKRNALTRPLISQLKEGLERVGARAEVRGVILAGAGPSFCAGVDLHEFAEGTPESARELIKVLAELCQTVRLSPKPVACAIQGHCLGGALELAACCDFRVCAPDAQLGMPEVFLGIPSVLDAVMLGHLVGAGRARELLLTGDSISGETAYAWGLATRLAPATDLVNVASDLLHRVTRHDADAIATQRRLHQQWLDLPYSDAVTQSQQALIDAFERGTPQRIAAARLRG
jgi:enoyl-CoA hydratase/carnithine racemase